MVKGEIFWRVDSGVMPEHPSFSEGKCHLQLRGEGRGKPATQPPKTKLLSKDLYGEQSPLTIRGHGTTWGTAAGRFGKAQIFWQGKGLLVGVALLAHLAIYKVLNKEKEKKQFSLLEWMQQLKMESSLSISIGYNDATQKKNLYDDLFSIGAFSAMEKGIFLSFSAGKTKGLIPHFGGTGHLGFLTVGASTLDRKLSAIAVLGNNEELDGELVYDFPQKLFPLVYAPYCRARGPR
ncbi:subtilisin-like protease [Salvia hispanica]|uniref:subtilisin-like protease n=1 Tax=Salvia hispanica TaxID=49212 RepID=UPI002009CCBE|nr:subtilisin-like protease [Salvia hispanica]